MTNLSSEDWVTLLRNRKSSLEAEARKREIGTPVIYRVDSSLRELKSELFDATAVSLGLFYGHRENHSNLPGDTLKLDVVINFLADTGHVLEQWKDVSAKVVPDPEGMKRLYDEHWHLHLEQESIQSSLAVDAIFLTCFLSCFFRNSASDPWNPLPTPATKKIFCQQHRRISVMMFKDVSKQENQIPLELMRNVMATLFRSRDPEATDELCRIRANEMLETICCRFVRTLSKRLPSFRLETAQVLVRDCDPAPVRLHECHHLLHCLAEAFWSGTEAPPNTEILQTIRRTPFALNYYEALKRKLITLSLFHSCTFRLHKYERLVVPKFQHLPTASKLHKYGIKFQGQKGFCPQFKKHAIFPWKAILYLPEIAVIDENTDAQWRNLLAFEDAYMSRREGKRSFMSYLHFMDQLINTEEDVALLLTGEKPVIGMNGIGEDKAVADLFNSVTKNHIFTETPEWSSVSKQLIHYYNARKTWFELLDIYVHKPWLVISVVGALVLLVLTFLQTFYAIKH